MKHDMVTKQIALVTLSLLIGACASTPEVPPFVPPVFPPPPEKPRFVFEHTLISSGQVAAEDKQARMRRILTGESQAGVGLGKPFDVQVCEGIVFVSDTVRRVVFQFDFPGGAFKEIGVEEPGALTKPMGLATDDKCNLYVADISEHMIKVYSRDGSFLRGLGNKEMFERLSAVAASPDGSRVFAVDTGGVGSDQHMVRVLDAVSGKHLYDVGSRGTEEGQFNIPKDIDVDADNNLYVVDSGNFRLQVLNKEGRFLSSIGSIGRRPGQFARPKGVAVDNKGRIYVSDASHGNFQIFDHKGRLLLNVGDRSTKFVPAGYMLPSGLDVDEDGRVYMVDQFFRKVDIYRPYALQTTDGYLGIWSQRAAAIE